MEGCIQRQLDALQCPLVFSASSCSGTASREFRRLVLWLEDQKIRALPVAGRDLLRKLDSVEWPGAFKSYLQELECPCGAQCCADGATYTQFLACVQFLLREAVSAEFEDNAAGINGAAARLSAFSSTVSRDAAIGAISEQLKLAQRDGTSSLERLSAIAERAEEIISTARLPSQQSNEHLATFELGFSTGEEALDHAASVLKMLYVDDMRELQLGINAIIVACQQFSIDPRTDSRLGKVGW